MPSGNAMLDGILWGGFHWGSSITYYFAHNGEFSGFDTNWTSTEQNGYRAALQSWANVANIMFTEVSTPGSATFIAHSVANGFVGGGTLGQHETPDGPPPADGYLAATPGSIGSSTSTLVRMIASPCKVKPIRQQTLPKALKSISRGVA